MYVPIKRLERAKRLHSHWIRMTYTEYVHMYTKKYEQIRVGCDCHIFESPQRADQHHGVFCCYVSAIYFNFKTNLFFQVLKGIKLNHCLLLWPRQRKRVGEYSTALVSYLVFLVINTLSRNHDLIISTTTTIAVIIFRIIIQCVPLTQQNRCCCRRHQQQHILHLLLLQHQALNCVRNSLSVYQRNDKIRVIFWP